MLKNNKKNSTMRIWNYLIQLVEKNKGLKLTWLEKQVYNKKKYANIYIFIQM